MNNAPVAMVRQEATQASRFPSFQSGQCFAACSRRARLVGIVMIVFSSWRWLLVLAFVLAREAFDQEPGLEREERIDVPAIDAARARRGSGAAFEGVKPCEGARDLRGRSFFSQLALHIDARLDAEKAERRPRQQPHRAHRLARFESGSDERVHQGLRAVDDRPTPSAQELHHFGMGRERAAEPMRPLFGLRGPVGFAVEVDLHAGHQPFDDRVDEALLATDVQIERHGRGTELGRDPARTDRRKPALAEEGEACLRDCVALEREILAACH